MSLYFDGFFACYLKADTPQEVIDTLHYMTREADYEFKAVPDHEFFKTSGWENFLRNLPNYEIAPGSVTCEFRKKQGYGRGDRDYSVSFRRFMHDDIEFYLHFWHFLYWIAPYSSMTGFVGYYREEYSLHPVLIYFKAGRVFWHKVKSEPDGVYKEDWNNPMADFG